MARRVAYGGADERYRGVGLGVYLCSPSPSRCFGRLMVFHSKIPRVPATCLIEFLQEDVWHSIAWRGVEPQTTCLVRPRLIDSKLTD